MKLLKMKVSSWCGKEVATTDERTTNSLRDLIKVSIVEGGSQSAEKYDKEQIFKVKHHSQSFPMIAIGVTVCPIKRWKRF